MSSLQSTPPVASTSSIVLLYSEEMSSLASRIVAVHNKSDRNWLAMQPMGLRRVRFANGELKVEIPETIRCRNVYLLHSMYHPDPNTALVELLEILDALVGASVDRVTIVLPYLSYTRQDRKDKPRVPITARMVARLIEVYRPTVERMITMDLHSDQIQGMYNIPVDNLPGYLVHREYFTGRYGPDYTNLVVMSPDKGGVTRASRFRRSLNESIPFAFIDKVRPRDNEVEMLNFVGDPNLSGSDAILYDDMIDTGGSIIQAAEAAKVRGARRIFAVAAHGVFSKDAQQKLRAAWEKFGLQVIVTDSIPRVGSDWENQWVTFLSLENILELAIFKSATGGSVSELFE